MLFRSARAEIVSECGADRFFEMPIRTMGLPTSGEVRLTGLGNLVRWKQWDLLLESIAMLPDDLRRRVRATVWGPIPKDSDSMEFARSLEAMAAGPRMEGRVVFGGPTHAVEQVLREADLFVLPSTNEPCSVALIEAMATGLPALVSASGGNVDIVRHGKTGLLFQPGSARDLALQLERVLRGEVCLGTAAEIRASVMGRCARDVAARYANIYARLAGNGTATP